MRINKYLAQNTNLSRRASDDAIKEGRVEINGLLGRIGDTIISSDTVSLDGKIVRSVPVATTIALNKPVGYVVSRNGQGSKTIYELLPDRLHQLNPVGRLDKDSSGLLIMTSDGNLLNRLAHPSFNKNKIYQVHLSDYLSTNDSLALKKGVHIGDERLSKMTVRSLDNTTPLYQVVLSEGRNRQIRRTFKALGLSVISLHRIKFGPYQLGNLQVGNFKELEIL